MPNYATLRGMSEAKTSKRSLTPLQQERRRRILDVTRHSLSKLGYEKLNMRDLAVAAEVSTATLYNLYQGKDTLILAALADLMSTLSGDREAQGLALMVSRFEAVSKQIAENPQFSEATCKLLFAANPGDFVVKLLLADVVKSYASTVEFMKQSGEVLPQTDSHQLSQDILGASWGLLVLWLKGVVPNESFRAQYLRALVQNLTPVLTDRGKSVLESHLQ